MREERGKLPVACSHCRGSLLLAVLSMLFSVFMMWDTAADVSWEAPLLALLLVLFTAGTLRHKARLSELISISRSGLHKMMPNIRRRKEREGSVEVFEMRSTENPMQEEPL